MNSPKRTKGTLQAGGGGKCATGKLRKGRWQDKEGYKRLRWKVFAPEKTDLMVDLKVVERTKAHGNPS